MNKTAIGVLAICLAATGLLWNSAVRVENKSAQGAFDRVAAGVMGNVSARVARYESVVEAARAFLKGQGSSFTPQQWQAFVRDLSIKTDYPGLDGVVFIQVVSPNSLLSYEQAMSAAVGQSVTVQVNPSATVYCPITYVAPLSHQASWIGTDLCSIPAAKTALVKAMQDDQTILTGPVAASKSGALVGFYTPIYQSGMSHDTPDQRTTAIKGWIGAPVRFDGMMNGLLNTAQGMDVQIFDGKQTDKDHLLYDFGGSWTGTADNYSGRRISTTSLDLAGRTWTLVFSEPKTVSQIPLALALAGLLCSALIFLWTLRGGRLRIEAQKIARTMTEELREAKARVESITFNVAEGIYSAKPNGVIDFANPSMAYLLGYDTETQLLNAQVSLPYADPEVKDAHERLLKSNNRFKDQEVLLRRRDGKTFYALLSQAAAFDSHGNVVEYDGAVLDITERKNQEKAIHNLAYFDKLTDLPNRWLLMDRLRLAIQQAERKGLRMALMFIDTDKFKQINDTLGHNVGDELLKALATRLSSCIRSTDTVARIGGDEFVVLLPEISSPQDAGAVAQKMVTTAGQVYKLLGNEITSTLSVGIAAYPEDGTDIETLMKHADIAMYHAKELGRNNFQYYKSDMTEESQEKMSLEAGLHKALDKDELRVLYTPIANLDTKEIVGVEASLAWMHPEKGLLYSDEILPLAIKNGLIIPIGEWLVATAFNDLRAWSRNGLAVPQLTIKLTDPQLLRSDVAKMIGGLVSAVGVPGSSLCFEISESTIKRDRKRALDIMRELRSMNAAINLAEFNLSPECIQLLSEIQFSSFTVSRAFVMDVIFNKAHASILRSLYALGVDMNLPVLTKEIDTKDQVRVLKGLGATLVQGQFLSLPISTLEFQAKLARLTANAGSGK